MGAGASSIPSSESSLIVTLLLAKAEEQQRCQDLQDEGNRLIRQGKVLEGLEKFKTLRSKMVSLDMDTGRLDMLIAKLSSHSKPKLQWAVEACKRFIQHLHCGGDRGCVATFGSNLRIVQNFTSDEPELHRALSGIKASGTTRLYDSIADIISHFRSKGDRSRPWVFVIVTDGMDNESKSYNAESVGRFVQEKYNNEDSNFIFAIGVGKDVDATAMGKMGDKGGFLSMHIKAFPLLELIFMKIALRVTTTLNVTRASAGRMQGVNDQPLAGVTWQQIQVQRELAKQPIDYCFLIDVSSSMSSLDVQL